MKNKFSTIVCDPPWVFSDSLKMSHVKRGAKANYDLLSLDDIKKLPIPQICDPKGSVLVLWTPSSLIIEGLEVMTTWGFDLKQSWIWVKTKKDVKNLKTLADCLSFGMGRLARNCHEIALVGTKGKIYDKLKNKSQRTVFFDVNMKHSQKTELVQDSLELMFPDGSNNIELFARRQRDGWLCLGNQSGGPDHGQDIRITLQKMIDG